MDRFFFYLLHYDQAITIHRLYGSNAAGVDSCLTSAYFTPRTCCKLTPVWRGEEARRRRYLSPDSAGALYWSDGAHCRAPLAGGPLSIHA